MGISNYTNRSALLVIAGLAVLGVSLVSIPTYFMRVGSNGTLPVAGPATQINDETAKLLGGKPHTAELTLDKTRRVRNAIKHADYSTAKKTTSDVLTNSHLQNWRFYPFSDFMNGITDVSDAAFETRLNEWVAQSKNDAIPLLIRAQYHYDIGWFKRGAGFAGETQQDNLDSFANHINDALTDIDAAIQLDDCNPYSFLLKLLILRGAGLSDNITTAFDQAIAKYPTYYPLYDTILGVLEPKWGGNVPAMYKFVDQYAGQAAENSPLKLLYLSLYRNLLNTVSVACWPTRQDRDAMAQCVASGMQSSVTPDLRAKVLTALQLYDHSDKYQFGVAIDRILFDLLQTRRGDTYAGVMLELAATSMHTDTQLKQEKPANNNYVIDKAVARSWYLKGFYDNAMTKDLEALKDVENTAFPSAEEKDLAIAGIYEFIGETYIKLGQDSHMVAYEQAALALGNIEDEQLICSGYYQLKDYDDAIPACNKAIEDQRDNLQARYWRGVAYRDSGQIDAALSDLAAVSGSESNFRASAAIRMSMIYFNRKDDKGALDVLNKYTYLYNPNTTSRDDVAVAYNNRCYAYMQLGELRKALDDCTESLKYGSIPDAFRKQQELMKRLGG
jgi:tetratricopeptide (TPR) repeat protein